MSHEAVTIVDGERNVVATATVEFQKGCFAGSVNTDRMPEPFRRLFEEYEEIVNNQIFSLLDPIEDRIGETPFLVVFHDGHESQVKDLQIFPRSGTVSFRAAGQPALLHDDRR